MPFSKSKSQMPFSKSKMPFNESKRKVSFTIVPLSFTVCHSTLIEMHLRIIDLIKKSRTNEVILLYLEREFGCTWRYYSNLFL